MLRIKSQFSYINATLAATVAQAETLAMMGQRLANVDQEQLHARVMKFMSQSRLGIEPTPEEIEGTREKSIRNREKSNKLTGQNH